MNGFLFLLPRDNNYEEEKDEGEEEEEDKCEKFSQCDI